MPGTRKLGKTTDQRMAFINRAVLAEILAFRRF